MDRSGTPTIPGIPVPGIPFDRLGLPGTKAISVVTNASNQLEVFAIGPENAIWHCAQTSNGWSGWENVGGWASAISVVVNGSGGKEIYAIGPDHSVSVRWQTSASAGWSDWGSLGGWAREISAVRTSHNNGGVEVYVIGQDDAVWSRWQDANLGNWSDWTSAGGNIAGGLKAIANPPAGIGLFGIDKNGQVIARQQKVPFGDWYGWVSIAGISVKAFSAIPTQNGGAEVFAIDQQGGIVRHAWRDNAWYGWTAWVVLDHEVQPAPTPPPPSATTYVPALIGVLLSDALNQLIAAGLKAGFVGNFTGEYQTNKLKVVYENPSAGTKVDKGTAVDMRVALAEQQTSGFKAWQIFNCSQRQSPVNIWLRSTTGWQQLGSIPYRGDIACGGAGSPSVTATFQNSQVNTVAAVDTTLLNCGQNDPNNVSCQYLIYTVMGNSNGPSVPFYIP